MELELSPEILLLAPLGNSCAKGDTGMLVGAARLAPSGVMSAPFGTTAKYNWYIGVAGNTVPIGMASRQIHCLG